MTSDLRQLTQKIIAFRDARDWAQFHKPKDVILSLFLEAAELAEHFQWKNDTEIQQHVASHREELGDELADILYWVLLIGHDLDIDLASAIEKKLAKNELKYPISKARGKKEKYDKL